MIGLFVTQVLSIAFLLGFISFYNSRIAVNEVAEQLQAEVSARIQQHMQEFLGTAQRINQLNADMIAKNLLANDDIPSLQIRYLGLMKSFDEPSSIYFGTPQGGIVGAGREVTGEFYVTETASMRAGDFVKTLVDADGGRLSIASTVPNFDATARPWYQRSVQSGRPVWSDVYVLFTGDDVAVAASSPVYADDGALLGVVAVDISAARLTRYLQSLQIGKTGMAFVMDRDGLLVASSLTQNVVISEQDGALARIAAVDSPEPAVRSAATFLIAHFADFRSIQEQALLRFSAERADYFVQVTPYVDEYGIDWLTVVVIPESDFMAQVAHNNRLTIGLSVVAVLFSIVVATVLAQKVSEPLQQMAESTRRVGEGQWTQLAHRSRVIEFQELVTAYNQMVTQLQQTMEQLSAEIALRRQTEQVLRDSEERLSFIVSGAQLGTWDWQTQTGEVTFNRRWAEMLGYDYDEIEPSVDSWQNLIHPQDLPEVMHTLEAHLRGETAHYQIEQRLRTKSGDWKWVLDVGRVVERDEQGAPIRAAGIHQDINERKQAEASLRASHQELELALDELTKTQERMMQQERMVAVGQLAAGIAHDFNN
ncbi:MAG: PAS domain-containing protein, partial [Caldilineaceae bacterium]|nr:PAS domain-containing protein [Caldilineaceae bacterium]